MTYIDYGDTTPQKFKIAATTAKEKGLCMKMKMKEHNGAIALMVTGTRQEIIITEEDGCLVIEIVNTAHSTTAPVHVQEESPPTNVLPLVLDDEVQDSTTPALCDDGLFQKLALLRKSLAATDKVPPYLVFHDKTLREMVDKMPADMQAMGNISGIGQAKLEKYGPVFLDVINNAA